MTSRYTAFQLTQLLATELNKFLFLVGLGDLPSLMKLHQEEAMVPVPRAADPLNRGILLFPAFSDPMLVPQAVSIIFSMQAAEGQGSPA